MWVKKEVRDSVADLSVVFEEPTGFELSYQAPYCRARGDVRSARFQPQGYGLWKVSSELGAGAELEWDAGHGDEAIFVLSGRLQVGEKTCSDEGVVIVEAGVPGVVRAVERSQLLHFGPVEHASPTEGPWGPASTEGRGFHVLTAEEAEVLRTGSVTFYSDGSCPTCRVAFFMVNHLGDVDGRVGPSHKHSESEIIHVLDGTMQVGPQTVDAGSSVAVPGERRYRYTTPGPLRFINYRRDAATFVNAPGSEPELETRERLVAKFGAAHEGVS